MANPRDTKKIPIEWDGDYSQPIKVSDYRDIGVTAVGTGTLQVLGTKEKYLANDNSVDFQATSTITNSFAPIVIADETVANSYVTSLSLSSQTKLAEVNTNLLTFICLLRSSDTVDAFVTATTNQ